MKVMWAGNTDIHECRPPAWLPKTHASADLGQCDSSLSPKNTTDTFVVNKVILDFTHLVRVETKMFFPKRTQRMALMVTRSQ